MLILLYDEVWPGTLTNVREGKSKNEKQGRVDRREVSFIFLLTIFFVSRFSQFPRDSVPKWRTGRSAGPTSLAGRSILPLQRQRLLVCTAAPVHHTPPKV